MRHKQYNLPHLFVWIYMFYMWWMAITKSYGIDATYFENKEQEVTKLRSTR